MFNSVQEHSKSTYGSTRHMQFAYRLIFVRCRFKGNTNETSFRSPWKMGFLAPRTGHISSYSSRIDSPECPLQNRVLGFQYFFLDPKPPKMTGFCPKRAQKPPQKRSKMHQKGPTKRPQNGVKMRKKTTPKCCQNDATMMRKQCQNDP